MSTGVIAGAAWTSSTPNRCRPHHPFRHLPGIVATPHVGYVSRGTSEVFFSEAVEDIVAFLAGAPVRVVAFG